jgi:chorismate mutase
MTIADRIREENTFNHVKALIEKGLDVTLIADAFKLPMQKIEDYINRIKSCSI